MKEEREQVLLRVYLRNTDKHGWFTSTVAETLVSRARSAGLAGGTVLRGVFGLGVDFDPRNVLIRLRQPQ